jgi:hypothetical protein
MPYNPISTSNPAHISNLGKVIVSYNNYHFFVLRNENIDVYGTEWGNDIDGENPISGLLLILYSYCRIFIMNKVRNQKYCTRECIQTSLKRSVITYIGKFSGELRKLMSIKFILLEISSANPLLFSLDT